MTDKEGVRTGGLRRWLAVLLPVAGCLLAGWLGQEAGRALRLAGDDFRPGAPPHIYVSGPRYLDADGAAAATDGRNT